jgi:hypothetical protein
MNETVPNLRDRICDMVPKFLDEGAFGLEVVGWDIQYGIWAVPTPQGTQNIPGYALMIAARGKGPGGAVILGRQDFIMNMDVLPGPIPTEDNVRLSVQGSYESLRTKIAQQRAGTDGQAQ